MSSRTSGGGDKKGAATSIELDTAHLLRVAPFLRSFGVPFSDSQLKLNASREALRNVVTSGEATVIVLSILLERALDENGSDADALGRWDTSLPPDPHALTTRARTVASNVRLHRESQSNVVNASAKYAGPVAGAVRLQCWATTFALLEALAGVSCPATDKELLLLGDLETAANFISRLERLAASPFVSVAEPARTIGGVESIPTPGATKDGKNPNRRVDAGVQSQPGHVESSSAVDSFRASRGDNDALAAVVSRHLRAHTAELEAKVAALELRILSNQQQQPPPASPPPAVDGKASTPPIATPEPRGHGSGSAQQPLPSSVAAAPLPVRARQPSLTGSSIRTTNRGTSVGRLQPRGSTVDRGRPTYSKPSAEHVEQPPSETRADWTREDDDALASVVFVSKQRSRAQRFGKAPRPAHRDADQRPARRPGASPTPPELPVTVEAPKDAMTVEARLALRRKEDQRRAAAQAFLDQANEHAHARYGSLEDALRLVQSWLRSRLVGYYVATCVEPRWRAATLIQCAVRFFLAIRRRRRLLGRSVRGHASSVTLGSGLCPRCAHLADSLATRLTADPMLPPRKVGQYLDACCGAGCKGALRTVCKLSL
jgi:hypothetical protein